MKVADIMTRNVVTIGSLATVAQAVDWMRNKGTKVLIVERLHPQDAYGIITETDIIYRVVAYGKNPQKMRVYEIMTKPCIVVNPNLAVEYAARLFSNTGIHCAPVIQEELIGVISTSDILYKSDFLDYPKETVFAAEIDQAAQKAEEICHQKGYNHSECQKAWQKVENLQAEAAHQNLHKIEKTRLEEYLESNPEARESFVLDNWCSG